MIMKLIDYGIGGFLGSAIIVAALVVCGVPVDGGMAGALIVVAIVTTVALGAVQEAW